MSAVSTPQQMQGCQKQMPDLLGLQLYFYGTYFSQGMHFLHILVQVHILEVQPRVFLIGQHKQLRWVIQ